MKKQIIKILTLTYCALITTACSTFFDKDNTPEPSQLVHFNPQMLFQTQWYANVGKGAGDEYLKLTPAVQNNVIYTTSNDGTITATDALGHRIWQVNIGHSITSGITSAQQTLFVGSDDGNVFALSATNGAILWQHLVPSEILAPITANNSVALVKTTDGRITALDMNNGHPLWHYQQTLPELILRGSSAPLIKNNSAIVGFASGKLAKLNLTQGYLSWIKTIAYPEGTFAIQRMVDIDANPIIVGDRVYVATYQGQIAALNLVTGNTIWTHKISSFSGIAADESRVFVSDAQSKVWAFDAETGNIIWHQDGLAFRNVTGPALIKNNLLVADGLGYLHVMSKQDGRFISRGFVNNSGILATPLVVNNVIYAYTKNGYLAALTLNEL